jgi:hypothetical protein
MRHAYRVRGILLVSLCFVDLFLLEEVVMTEGRKEVAATKIVARHHDPFASADHVVWMDHIPGTSCTVA